MPDRGAERLRRLFATVRSERRAALLPFLTAGIPDLDSSASMFEAMADAGADGFEIGIPYSDPLMDGPVIAEAAERSLASGMTIERAFRITDRVTSSTGRPALLMTYTNPVMHYGPERFARDAASAGADGLIIADLPVEEAGPFLAAARKAGTGMALFAAPTTTDARLEAIVRGGATFIYAVAAFGVTGERAQSSDALATLASRIRSISDLPIVAGVGISNPEQAAAAARHADGVIVGSALVRRVIESASADDAARSVGDAVRALSAAVRSGTSATTSESLNLGADAADTGP